MINKSENPKSDYYSKIISFLPVLSIILIPIIIIITLLLSIFIY